MPKNLIYANADEFHVKSTVVYAKDSGSDDSVLYWDPEFTKPIYNDELERLFLAGGLKVYFKTHKGSGYVIPHMFLFPPEGALTSEVVASDGHEPIFFVASPRESSSESEGDGMAPIEHAHQETP